MLTSRTKIRLDDLLALSATARIEVIDGELVEISPVGGTHHYIARNAFRLLDAHALAHDLGEVFFDGLIFIVDGTAESLRGSQVPDVSFVCKGSRKACCLV